MDHVSLAAILQIAGTFIAAFALHRSLADKQKETDARMVKMETKLDIVFRWFSDGVINEGKTLQEVRRK
jgi:hypothetical protein